MRNLFFFLLSIFCFLLYSSPALARRIQPKPEPVSSSCIRTGCSGQICSDTEVMSTCEFREEYACYNGAKCERQQNGRCEWTQTEILQQCLGKGTSTITPTIRPRLPTSATCIPRPACLDQNPPCRLAIRPEFCPSSTTAIITPSPTPIPFPTQTGTQQPLPPTPTWINILPPQMKNLMEMLYLWKNFYGKPTNKESLLQK